MRKRLPHILILLFSLFACTSCFDLQENLFLKKDGSGNFSFIIDMAQFKSMMAMFDSGSDTSFHINNSPNEKLNSTFEKTKRKLLNTAGISNVKPIEDTANFKFGLSFDFKNITALNKGMNRLFEDDSIKPGTKETVYFDLKDNQLIRYDVLDSKSIFAKTGSLTDNKGSKNNRDKRMDNSLFNLDELFATVSYSTNYEFDKKIDNSQNVQSLLSSSMKKVSIKCYPFASAKDSTQKKCSIANTITFK